MTAQPAWHPPSAVALEDVIKLHHEVTAMPDIAIDVREDIFRIRELEMDWDIGAVIYQPQDAKRIPSGADGKKAGVFLLHGGVSDFKSVERIARTLPSKFGIKVVSMTFPGRFYFRDPDRDWPGDVENGDGTARTPLWTKEMRITPDQYTIVQDTSKREDYGTLISLSAKEGTEFFQRMAAWPVAFEQAIQETARRHFPDSEFSIYIHGHSTGGPVRHDGLAASAEYCRPGRLRQLAFRLDVSVDQRRRLGISVQSIAPAHLARHCALHVRGHEKRRHRPAHAHRAHF